MSLAAIRTGIAQALSAISGLRALDYDSGAFEPPAAIVGLPARIDYDQTMGRGTDALTIPLRVYVSMADDRAGDNALEGYLAKSGPTSIKAAIETDRTLGGACADVRVAAMTGAGVFDVGGVIYIGADFELDVLE